MAMSLWFHFNAACLIFITLTLQLFAVHGFVNNNAHIQPQQELSLLGRGRVDHLKLSQSFSSVIHLGNKRAKAARNFCLKPLQSEVLPDGGQIETKSRTQRLMETVPEEQQTGNAGGASNYEGLLRMDATWKAIRNMKEGAAAGPAPVF
ncbi:unnamed protein product, partial [Heterosigma akashiwo]